MSISRPRLQSRRERWQLHRRVRLQQPAQGRQERPEEGHDPGVPPADRRRRLRQREGHAVPARTEEPVPGGDGRAGGGALPGLLRGLLRRQAAQGRRRQVQEHQLAQKVSRRYLLKYLFGIHYKILDKFRKYYNNSDRDIY